MSTVRQWVFEHGLLLANLLLFLAFLVGMALTGVQVYNDEQIMHGAAAVPFWQYVTTGDFVEAVFENWESEFLQMGMYVVLTIFLFQKGSSESKPIGESTAQDEDPRKESNKKDAPWPVRHGGIVLSLYENSLVIMFFLLFAASFVLHAVGGAEAYSQEEMAHGGGWVTPVEYLGTSQFWFESFQNWQSEFLAVAFIVGASVYLRQKGSAESKPVSAPHAETGA
ncbi:MAG: hypothetical protein JWL94_1095 [Microbacteriaceae bacterium]|jgi:hypothetical protein|nr:hypothetical protein [Microbacteriaceae bacterium]HEV7956713.1 DUF6766 family protein [Marisediminicola sp.]